MNDKRNENLMIDDEKMKVEDVDQGGQDKGGSDDFLKNLREWVRSIFIALVLAILIKSFLFEPTLVSGSSMENTLHDRDRLIIDKITLKFRALERGDIVVLKYDENNDYIKRVVGLPGEVVQIIGGKVYVNGKVLEEDYINSDKTDTINGYEWKLGKGEYFVMGDNRLPGKSSDSRVFGPVSIDRIKGVADIRFYPFDKISILR